MTQQEEDTPSQRPRRAQIPAEVARRRMIDAGVRYVDEHGLTAEFGPVPLEAIIRDAEVPRATVYRHWRSQADYVTDLIAEVFRRPQFAVSFSPSTSATILETIDTHRHLLGEPAGRRAVMREVIRIAAEHNLREVLTSRAWAAYNTLYHVADTRAEPALRAAARAIEDRFIAANATLYESALETLHLRAKAPHTVHTIAVAANIVVGGFANRIRVDSGSLEHFYLDGPGIDGTPAPWHLVSTLTLAAIEPLIDDAD